MTADERKQALSEMTDEIALSPVLTALGVYVRDLRGRFYLNWKMAPSDEEPAAHTWGRMTPIEEDATLLLELEFSRGHWSEVARGEPRELIERVAAESKGMFHGLGRLDASLRVAHEQGADRLQVTKTGANQFAYRDTGAICSVQEALYHYFEVPIPVIAQPRAWYARHRTPHIVESSEDKSRVLVRFLASSWSGETFGGTCLYLVKDGTWDAYTIKPSESTDIATAERWLVKRKWKPW